MGATLRPPPGRGPPCFRISGQIFHRSGCLHPPVNVEPSFSQLFILETADAINIRLNNPANNDCLEELFVLINNVMQQISPFFMAHKNMHEIEIKQQRLANQENRAMSVVTMHFRSGPDRRRYNNPSADEVAAVL